MRPRGVEKTKTKGRACSSGPRQRPPGWLRRGAPAHRNRDDKLLEKTRAVKGEEHESASQQSTHPTGDGWMDSDRVWARLPSDPLGGTVCVLYHEYSCTTEQMFLVFVFV